MKKHNDIFVWNMCTNKKQKVTIMKRSSAGKHFN